MPGFKRTLQSMNPQGFWTFDGEDYDGGSRLFTSSPTLIIDESDVQNHGTLNVGFQEPSKAYRAGMSSLVELEPADQNSIGFGTYGRVNGVYPKAFVQIPDVQAYETAQNAGSFTFAFMFRKMEDENSFRTLEQQYYVDLPRPILRKKNTMIARIIDRYYTEDEFNFEFPCGIVAVPASKIVDFYTGVHFVVLRYSVTRVQSVSQYVANAEVIINGELVGSLAKSYADVPPDSHTDDPIEIGGFSESLTYFSDRCVNATYIDQVAFFTRAITNLEIYRLYKKIWQFKNLILKKNPSIYIPFQDDDYATTNVLFLERPLNSVTATHLGSISKAHTGPQIYPNNRSVAFFAGMVVVKNNYSYSSAPMAIDADNHAMEFFLKAGGTERSTVVSMQGIERPFGGPLVELNVDNNGNNKAGWISYCENEQGSIAAYIASQLNDGDFHHFIFQRRAGDWLEMMIDGSVVAAKKVAKDTINAFPSVMTLMGSMPGRLYCVGEMSHFVFYNGRTFTPEEAMTRASYRSIFRVRGNTTLRGVPYRAQVRVYDFVSGGLLSESYSNLPDGDFEVYLKDNSRVNIMVAGVNDTNVRVRAFGPLNPAEIEDPPEG